MRRSITPDGVKHSDLRIPVTERTILRIERLYGQWLYRVSCRGPVAEDGTFRFELLSHGQLPHSRIDILPETLVNAVLRLLREQRCSPAICRSVAVAGRNLKKTNRYRYRGVGAG
jgi:hypothetical protein